LSFAGLLLPAEINLNLAMFISFAI